MRLNRIYAKYRDVAHFFCVYIQEMHPEDGWQLPENVEQGVIYSQPQTSDERAALATSCVVNLRLAIPVLLDSMSNDVDALYAALPDRLYIINAAGVITYRSEPGPRGFDLEAWEEAIHALLPTSGREPVGGHSL